MPLRELIDVNTQVRRLGYFYPLLRFAARQNLNADSLALRLQKWGIEQESDFDNYINTTGNVVPHLKKTRRRSVKNKVGRLPTDRASHAARRYVDFGANIGWLNQISGMYAVSRTGRILLAITDELQSENKSLQEPKNLFRISEVQSLFFFSELWRKDGDVIFTLIKMLDKTSLGLKEIQVNYHLSLRDHLQNRLRSTPSEKDGEQLLRRITDIGKWQKPERYAEQFVPTRLNWLLDLGLVSIDNTTKRFCSLTEAGVKLAKTLDEPKVLTNEWINTFFFKSFAVNFAKENISLSHWCESGEQKKMFTDCLKLAFEKFKRNLVPKFSVTQISLFVCLAMIEKNSVVMDYLDFITFMSNPLPFGEGSVVEMRLSARENEAYLIINPI